MASSNLKNYQNHFKNNKNFLTIDPGMRVGGGTGLAYFKDSKLYKTKSFTCDLKDPYRRMDILCNSIDNFFYKSTHLHWSVFIEKPRFMESFKGITAAKSESLFKLISFYGRLIQVFTQHGLNVVPLEIHDWKGQLSKSQTKQRILMIKRSLPKIFPNHSPSNLITLDEDQLDAIGMGLYLLGEFRNG